MTIALSFLAQLLHTGLMIVAGALVLAPKVPLGTLTEGVQTLAGVLLPSATVFLLLLCNDREVLGPWANSAKTNVITSVVIGVLILMSVILTASVLFPHLSSGDIESVIFVGLGAGVLLGGYLAVHSRLLRSTIRPSASDVPDNRLARRTTWRTPPLAILERQAMSTQRKAGMLALRCYLFFAFAVVIVKIVKVAVAG